MTSTSSFYLNSDIMDRKRKALNEPPTLEDQERLIEIMNDSPRVKSFAGTRWEIKAMKPGTQWLIAQEAIAIQKAESADFSDVVKQFASNIPSVVRVLVLGLLNDRERIFANGRSGEYSEEFNSTYDTILWNTNQQEWMALLVEVLSLLDVEFFFLLTSSIGILRQSLLERKTTTEEARQLSQEPNSGK